MKKSIFAVGLLFLVNSVFAWEFQPQPITETDQPVPEVEDADGRLCSLLHIQTTVEDLEIENAGSQGLCLVPQKVAGGYDVYVSPGTRKLLLKAPLFMPFEWDLVKRIPFRSKRFEGNVLTAGKDPRRFNIRTMGVHVFAQKNPTAIASAERDLPLLVINTDLPFAAVETYFLRKGKYQVVADISRAPYLVLVANGTSLADVLQQVTVAPESQDLFNRPLQGRETVEAELRW